MTEFSYTSVAQQVIFGIGAVNQLSEAVDGFGWQRLMLCTIPRLLKSGLVSRLEQILGQRMVASYTQVQPHVPQEQVEVAVALAADHEC